MQPVPVPEPQCWFCSDRVKSADHNAQIQMYGRVTEESQSGDSVTYTWQQHMACVPRCRRCQAAHQLEYQIRLAFAVPALVVAGVLIVFLGYGFLMTFATEREPWMLITAVAAVIAGLALPSVAAAAGARAFYLFVPRGIKPSNHARLSPQVIEAKGEGYRIGAPYWLSTWGYFEEKFRSMAGIIEPANVDARKS